MQLDQNRPLTKSLDERAKILGKELRGLLQEAADIMEELRLHHRCTTEFNIPMDSTGRYRLTQVLIKRVTTSVEEF